MKARLDLPPRFSLRRVLASHGWYELPPFTVEGAGEGLQTVVALPGGGARRIVLREAAGAIVLESPGAVDAATRRVLVRAARRILALDADLTEFHERVAADPRYAWIAASGRGRMLRSPSMFEDLVKLVLTTNCSWAFTKKMAAALVARYGEPAPDGGRSFPTASRLARVPEAKLRDEIRAGYRAPYLAALSKQVASGRADVEGWDADPRDAAALRREMLALPGVGPYVAENLLKFLARPDGLGLDSWMRAKYAKIYHGGRKITDRTIARRCAPLGRWAGLALWFDLTRDWTDESNDSQAAWITLS